MPCHAAMIEKFETAKPEQTVEDVLALMKKKGLSAIPVAGKGKVLEGLFSLEILMENLLPVSVAMSDGLQNEVSIAAAPGVAKRLKKVAVLPVSEFMDSKPPCVYPETQIWEAVGLITQNGEPLLVVDQKSKKLVGLLTAQSVLDELQRLQT